MSVNLKVKLAELATYVDPVEEGLLDKVLEVVRAARSKDVGVEVTLALYVKVTGDYSTPKNRLSLGEIETICEDLNGELVDGFTSESTGTAMYAFM